MLHWLAGQRSPDRAADPDNAGYFEAPETPAPVFAVRAFKHAIFGTPQTVQPKPRRHSNTEQDRVRHNGMRPPRPTLTRPKSASDVISIAAARAAEIPDPLASPTKGILMTPGTVAVRRKTVTFGDHVVDNEEKKPSDGSKSGLPDDCPGKFPSPWSKTTEAADKDEPKAEDRKRARSKLTEELQKVRNETEKSRQAKNSVDDCEMSQDVQEPKCETGRYWKQAYDVYRENTMREVKKLVTKQRAAKSYARDKDSECTELADQLRREKKRADKLEKRNAVLEAEIRCVRQSLTGGTAAGASNETAAETGKAPPSEITIATGPSLPSTDVRVKGLTPKIDNLSTAGDALKTANKERPTVESSSSNDLPQQTKDSSVRASIARVQRKPRENPEAPHGLDIWTQNLPPSNPASTAPRSLEAVPLSPAIGRTVTSGTDLTPLVSLSINTLPKPRISSPERSPRQHTLDNRREPRMTDHADKPKADKSRRDSLDPRDLPQSNTPQPTLSQKPSEISTSVPESSPFQMDPFPQKLTPTTAPTVTVSAMNCKENVSPTARKPVPRTAKSTSQLSLPPQSSQQSKRIVSKEGVEVPEDRVAAARARIAARGRPVS